MLSPEELLRPRFKVIAKYPDSTYRLGQIIKYHEKHWHPFTVTGWRKLFDPYPHLFKPLAWWEERKPEDMPEYVKCEGRVAKARFDLNETSAFFMYLDSEIIPYSPDQFKPATSEEYALYLTYKNKSDVKP